MSTKKNKPTKGKPKIPMPFDAVMNVLLPPVKKAKKKK